MKMGGPEALPSDSWWKGETVHHPDSQWHGLQPAKSSGATACPLDLGRNGRSGVAHHRSGTQGNAPQVRSAAIRVSEAHLNGSIGPVALERLTSHQFDLPEVQLQLGMTLGESEDPKALKVLANMLSRNANHPYMASAILSGLENREADMLQAITQPSGWLPTDMNASLTAVHQDLAACVIRGGDTSSLLKTIALLQGLESSLQKNILAGFRAGGFKKSQGEWVLAGEPITLPSSPDAILEAVQSSDKEVTELANRVLEAFSWPGKATTAVKVTLAEPLTEAQQERFETGKTLYTFTCGAYHQPWDGAGRTGSSAERFRLGHWLGGAHDSYRLAWTSGPDRGSWQELGIAHARPGHSSG